MILNHIYGSNFREPFEKGGMQGHVDLSRLSQGKMGARSGVLFVPCRKNIYDLSDEAYAPGRLDVPLKSSLLDSRMKLDLWKRNTELKRSPQTLGITIESVIDAAYESDEKTGAFTTEYIARSQRWSPTS